MLKGVLEVDSPGRFLGGNCRGRDDHLLIAPAQIRTSAFTHTALTMEEWRQSERQDGDAECGELVRVGCRVAEQAEPKLLHGL